MRLVKSCYAFTTKKIGQNVDVAMVQIANLNIAEKISVRSMPLFGSGMGGEIPNAKVAMVHAAGITHTNHILGSILYRTLLKILKLESDGRKRLKTVVLIEKVFVLRKLV
jgi:hypothetical protein